MILHRNSECCGSTERKRVKHIRLKAKLEGIFLLNMIIDGLMLSYIIHFIISASIESIFSTLLRVAFTCWKSVIISLTSVESMLSTSNFISTLQNLNPLCKTYCETLAYHCMNNLYAYKCWNVDICRVSKFLLYYVK